MCRFITEDGEQCGRDDEPFCWQHEDTPQSHFYHSMEDLKSDLSDVQSMVAEARDARESGSSGIQMDSDCDECGAALRRRERLTQHPNVGGRVLFEAYVECDCSEHVLGAESVRLSEVPDGWY